MDKQSIEEKFELFWFGYPTDLCKNKRGGKQPALKAFKKINPDQKEFYRMMENMKAQIRADRKDKDFYRWPFVSSYLNQARYDDVIASESVRMDKENLKTCSIDKCHNDVHGSSFVYCADHIPNAHSDLLANAYRSLQLDIKSPDFIDRCRSLCRQGLNNMMRNE